MPRTRRGDPKGPPGSGAAGSATATIDGPRPESAEGESRSRRRYDPAWDEWRRPRRWPGVLITCIVVLGFIAALGWTYRPHGQVHRPTIVPSAVQHVLPPYVPGTNGGATVTAFAGKSNASGLAFASNGGLLLLNARCVCAYSFVVTVSDLLGNIVTIPVTSTGAFDGTLPLSLNAGRYTLSVVPSGPWTIRLIQPSAAMPAISTPFEYFSSGGSVIGPFSSANQFLGLKFLSFTSGGVAVHILNLAGTDVALPFAGRGIVQKTATLTGLPNPYYVEVDAAGYWLLTVRRSATG